jgi:succinoglycan biosynthesis protein ExoA
MNHDRRAPNIRLELGCSVLVPVLNEEQHVAATVAAMQRQRFDGPLEFLLVDGGSEDRTRAMLEELALQDERIRVLDNPRRYTPSGLNVALANARGRWVCRMDAHTEYADDYIALGTARLAGGDTRWVSGPPIARGHGRVSRAIALAMRTPLGRGASRKWAAERADAAAEYELDAGVFAGVWERATLLDYGGWDERWPRNQDSEMAGRFLARGEKLICLPGMASYYSPRNSLWGLWTQYLQYGEYREKTARRHPNTMRRSHLIAPALVLTLPAAVLAPRPIRLLARLGTAAYGLALIWAGLRARAEAQEPADALLVPIVLALMHVGHGSGALRGAVRHGPPLEAVAEAFGIRHLRRDHAASGDAVFAPSLFLDDDDEIVRARAGAS